MLIFEVLQEDSDLLSELTSLLDIENYEVDSLDGNDIIQVLVPLASILAPVISQTIQKYFDNNRITIKFDGVEISAMGYEKAMKLLKEVSLQRESKKDDKPTD